MPTQMRQEALKLIERKTTDAQLDEIIRAIQGLPKRPADREPLTDLFSWINEVKDQRAAPESTRSKFDPTMPIDWKNNQQKISKFFTVGEVTQNDPARVPMTEDVKKNVLTLSGELDKIREEWGSPIGVTSWYRPLAVNRAVGGSSQSQHLNGGAVDIYPMDGDIFEFQSWLDKNWGGGLGYGANRGFVHLDLRDGRFKTGTFMIRWDY
jgi:uncharacterized protein YcbK (DUF882 family)